MRNAIILLNFLIILLASCSQKEYSSENTREYTTNAVLPESGAVQATAVIEEMENVEKKTAINDSDGKEKTQEIEKQIIKTANLSFGVSDYKKSKISILAIISKNKAYVSSEDESNSSSRISNTIVVRVPKENFDSLLNALEGQAGTFESKSVNTVDVTEEFVDIISRLKNKKQTEEQYLEILKKAKTISEILEVNEHIRVVREEIEAKEGRLKYLQNQVGFSTVTLYVHQDFDTVTFGFGYKISEALENGWEGLLIFFVGLVTIWPLFLILGVIFIIIRKLIRRAKKRNEERRNLK